MKIGGVDGSAWKRSLGAAFGILGCIVTPLLASQFRVGVMGEYGTIGEAIGHAGKGDTILVSKGVYHEQVQIDKPLVLLGLDWPVIDGEARDGDVVTVKADSVTVRGFIIQRSGSRIFYNDSGLKLLGVCGARIEGNHFLDTNYGVYVQRACDNLVRRNSFYGRAERKTEETTGDGIHLWNSPRNRIEANDIQQHRDGIYIEFSPQTMVLRNHVSHVIRYGLHYMYSNDNLYEENIFEESRTGSALMYSKHITLRRNVFQRNRGSRAFGILFKDCNDSLMEENILRENTTGIFMDGSNRNLIRRNLIEGNGWALDLFTSCDQNIFVENSFLWNDYDLLLDTRRTTNRFFGVTVAGDTVGNFWNGYQGYDLNGDGMGDVPYRPLKFFSYLSKRYPDLRVLMGGPAAQALQWAERAFPILSAEGVEDRFPLMRPRERPVSPSAQPRRFSLPWLSVSMVVLVFSMGVIIRSLRLVGNVGES